MDQDDLNFQKLFVTSVWGVSPSRRPRGGTVVRDVRLLPAD
jgi:hypothetical protein